MKKKKQIKYNLFELIKAYERLEIASTWTDCVTTKSFFKINVLPQKLKEQNLPYVARGEIMGIQWS